MVTSDIQEKAMSAMIAMNAAIQRIRLFPVSNPSTIDYIDKAHGAISDLFQEEVAFSLEMTEDGTIVCGAPLGEKRARKAQVAAFLDLLAGFRVRSLVIDPRLDRSEFTAFLELLAEKPASVTNRGGLSAATAEADLGHILVDGRSAGKAADDTADPAPGTTAIEPMLSSLETILEGADREVVCRHLGRSILSKDDGTICTFLSRKMDGDFRESLLAVILDGLDDARYERILAGIRRRREAGGPKRGLSTNAEATASLDAAWRNLTRSPRGRGLLESMNRGTNHRIKSGMERLFKGEKSVFQDTEFLLALPDVIDRFLAKGNQKAVEGLIDRLADALLTQKPDVRAKVAPILSRTMGRLITDPAHEALMLTLSYKLAGWVRAETQMSQTYRKVCIQLRDVARRMIDSHKFEGCRHILKIFNFIHAGRVRKKEEMVACAGRALEEIADPQLTSALLEELNAGDEGVRKQATDRLVLLGAGVMDTLLDRLGESPSRKERSRIIRVIYLMGKTALPKLEAAVGRDAPWYYVRNLILLFGKVGTESHLDAISSFLEHRDLRVRREALNSIYNIGGQEGRRRVLEALPQADDALKLNIIGLLGAWQEREAVYPLMKLLESDTLATSKLKNELAERICNAFAAIGAREAVPLLREIAEDRKKGVFASGRGYGEVVRAAAQAGIDAIERKAASENREKSGSGPVPSGSESGQQRAVE